MLNRRSFAARTNRGLAPSLFVWILGSGLLAGCPDAPILTTNVPFACTDNAQCLEGFTCIGGECRSNQPEGAQCTGGDRACGEPASSCLQSCTGGKLTPCQPSSGPVDFQTSLQNCGACGKACKTRPDLSLACVGGSCTCFEDKDCQTGQRCSALRICVPLNDPCLNVRCPANEACRNGTCAPAACGGTVKCQPGERCENGICKTVDACHLPKACPGGGGACQGDAVPDGTGCDDGQQCTQADVCTGGNCAGMLFECPDLPCSSGRCDGAGGCSYENKTDGVACQNCGGTGTCSQGFCSGQSGCRAATQCESDVRCLADGGCQPINKPSDAGCNDMNACTSGDLCSSGACTGTAYTCQPMGPCQISSVCNGDGGCTVTNVADNTPCNDGNACSFGDTCQSGQCTATVYTCPMATQCTTAGTCLGDGGCLVLALDAGTACDDGNACSFSDQCSGTGSCTGTSYSCPGATNCRDAGVCLGDGGCQAFPHPNGTTCNDGQNCSFGDQCTNGACSGTNYSCPNATQCAAAGVCIGDGGCQVTFLGTTTPCTDGNNCTHTDRCNGMGSCAGTTYACANVPCQAGSCLGDGGCGYSPIADNSPCTDSISCTTGDRCVMGACVPTGTATTYEDVDNDGVGGSNSTLLCPTPPGNWVGSTGDCDDTNGAVFQSVNTGLDQDRDGHTTSPAAVQCVGPTSTFFARTYHRGPDAGFNQLVASQILSANDCADLVANAYPGQTAYFTAAMSDGGFDYNCNGVTDRQLRASSVGTAYNATVTTLPVVGCTTARPAGVTGWVTSAPNCGQTGTFRQCIYDGNGTNCNGSLAVNTFNTVCPATGNWETNNVPSAAQVECR